MTEMHAGALGMTCTDDCNLLWNAFKTKMNRDAYREIEGGPKQTNPENCRVQEAGIQMFTILASSLCV